MIRILVVDDHPAVRAGLVAMLRSEPGLTPVAAAETAAGALEEARRSPPDVAIVDYHLPDGNGLELTTQLKRLSQPPRVVIYSAMELAALASAARAAGADGMVDKAARVYALFDVVRRVAAGEQCLPDRPRARPSSTSQQTQAVGWSRLPA